MYYRHSNPTREGVSSNFDHIQFWRERFTREDFLYDFDYMFAALEANFPSFGIIYRLHGVDMLEIAESLRDRLETKPTDIDFEVFWNMLRDDFFYYATPDRRRFPVGHLRLVSDDVRWWLLSQYTIDRMWGPASYFLSILRSPPAHPSYPYLIAQTHPFISSPNWDSYQTISTSIIKEGEIGYLRIYRLWGGPSPDEWEQLSDFYSDIEDFEHLIIDIRGNTGGSRYIFDDIVIRYLIDQPVHVRFHHFLLGGEHNIRFFQAAGAYRRIMLGALNESAFNDERGHRLFAGNYVSSYVTEDIDKMSYRFLDSRMIRPWQPSRRSTFDGKIWLLIDENNYSATLEAAATLKEIGFATLVGETTDGGAGSPWHSNYIVLPNTGIIIRYDPTLVIDVRGRPLEYGIEPHYFNRPGMDALDTVLAMIVEGVY